MHGGLLSAHSFCLHTVAIFSHWEHRGMVQCSHSSSALLPVCRVPMQSKAASAASCRSARVSFAHLLHVGLHRYHEVPETTSNLLLLLLALLFNRSTRALQRGSALSWQMSVCCGWCTHTQCCFCCWQSLSSIFCGPVTRWLCCCSAHLWGCYFCATGWAAAWVSAECPQVMALSSLSGTAFFPSPLHCVLPLWGILTRLQP